MMKKLLYDEINMGGEVGMVVASDMGRGGGLEKMVRVRVRRAVALPMEGGRGAGVAMTVEGGEQKEGNNRV